MPKLAIPPNAPQKPPVKALFVVVRNYTDRFIDPKK